MERARASRKGVRGRRIEGGHCIGSTSDPSSGRLHVPATVAAQIQSGCGTDRGPDRENLRYQKIAGRGRRNLLFIVDTSGSMLSTERLAQVKGCIVSLLRDAYAKRTCVALVSYGGVHARLVLPFTSSAEMAARRIKAEKAGGGTPLLEALGVAALLIDRLDGEAAEIVLLSDGRYNRGVSAADRKLRLFGAYCKRAGVPIHLVDAASGGKTARARVALLAERLGADLRTLDDLRAPSS